VSSRTSCFTRAGPQPCVAACVSSARFERALPTSSTSCLLPLGLRGHESRHPVPTRAIRRTKAKPQPCATAWLGNQGSNLDSLASGASVLPDYTIPHRYAGRDSNPHTVRFELASFAGLALPARAPPGIRTPTSKIKSLLLSPVKLAALESRTGESNPDDLLGRQTS
jgi:hypothetical protein